MKIERFGNWIEDKKTPFDELKDMPGAGQGLDIFKKLINNKFEVIVYNLLSMGGVDVLGGWAFQTLLSKIGGHYKGDEEMIDTNTKTDIAPDFESQQEGMAILESLYSGTSDLKIPFYWRSIAT